MDENRLQVPNHPIISTTMHRDTLDRVAQILTLLQYMDLSDDINPRAESGLYWIHAMLIDTVKYVSDALGEEGKLEPQVFSP